MRKRKVLIISFAIILAFTLFSVDVFRRNYVVPIIAYHSVNPKVVEERKKIIVSVETFERQMRFLKSQHYHVLPLEEAAALIKEKKNIPAKTIAITFDDGYKDNYTYAFPILKKYNLAATMFIIINEVGRPRGDRLSWDEIKEMQESGIITFGSHAMGPDPLVKIESDAGLKREIFESKKILEQKLGSKVSAFSYPEGRFNAKIKKLVIEAGYRLAVATNPGKGFPNDDIFALKRLRISENAKNLFIFWIETSGFYNFMREYRHK